jgi:hypothetical protein
MARHETIANLPTAATPKASEISLFSKVLPQYHSAELTRRTLEAMTNARGAALLRESHGRTHQTIANIQG